MDNQQGPAIEHRELCSTLPGSLVGRGFGGEWIHVNVWLSPFPVQVKLTTLLICYAPIQTKFKKNRRIILGFAGTSKRSVQVAEMKVVKYDLLWNMSWRNSQQTWLVDQMWGVKIMELIFIEMNNNSFSRGNQRIFIQTNFEMPIKHPRLRS